MEHRADLGLSKLHISAAHEPRGSELGLGCPRDPHHYHCLVEEAEEQNSSPPEQVLTKSRHERPPCHLSSSKCSESASQRPGRVF